MVSSEELFDVVDEHDRVVDQQPRSTVHRVGARHRAVHVFLFRSDGRMLIHKRSPLKEEFPDVWTSSASGHVTSGEDYDETAPRELREELSVSAELQRLHKFAACPDTCNEFTVLYQASSDQPIQHDPGEIAETRWVDRAELESMLARAPDDFSPAFRLLFNWFRDQDTQQQFPLPLNGH